MSHGNEDISKIMPDKHMKLTLRRETSKSCINLDNNLYCDVCKSSLVFLCYTVRSREVSAHSQNLTNDLQYYGNIPKEEHEKLVIFLSKMIKEEKSEREVDVNLIRIPLKCFIDSNYKKKNVSQRFFLII